MTNILSLIDGYKDGNSWEELCNSCYNIRYKNEHYTPIPAVYRGDAGIEGFTTNGIVNQCYSPERVYTDDELYNHLRDKMTTDIGKLKNEHHQKRLKDLGVPTIHEWHFVIPYYKDSRIIEHAETKRIELLTEKEQNPSQYTHIADDFRILIKTAETYRIEITQLLRTNLTDMKLNLDILKTTNPDWESCPSEKLDNIKRKVKAIMGDINDSNSDDYNQLIDLYSQAYIEGLSVLRELRVSYGEIYEEIVALEQSYKRQVEIKTKMNTNSSINQKIFTDILNDFGEKLSKEFKYFNVASITKLQIDIICGWLADCSMQFKR